MAIVIKCGSFWFCYCCQYIVGLVSMNHVSISALYYKVVDANESFI